MNASKTWFITGASRGLGLEATKAALASGDNVVATVRSRADQVAADLNNANLLVVTLDITNETQVRQAISQAIRRFGKIDVLLNNAGFGLLGAIEEVPDEAIRRLFDTNVFGTLNVIRNLLPHFRNQHSGHIINMSSVGGLVGSAGWGLYNSTKFAIEGISEALANELAPLNIRVTAVEPGYFRTNFLDGSSLVTAAHSIEDYANTVGNMRTRAVEVNNRQPGDPKKLAAALLQIAHSTNPPLHLPLGKDALERYQAKTAAFQQDIEVWQAVITGTDHNEE